MTSPYPVHRIWRFNQADWNGAATLDLGASGVLLLIRRVGGAVEFQPIAAAEYEMLSALLSGRAFADAYEEARSIDEQFDPADFLRRHFAAGNLVDFE